VPELPMRVFLGVCGVRLPLFVPVVCRSEPPLACDNTDLFVISDVIGRSQRTRGNASPATLHMTLITRRLACYSLREPT